MNLLNDNSLEGSSVVANSRMNRERGAAGVNSYEKDIGLNPISFLMDRVNRANSASWLDVCCGRGRALIDAANAFCNLRLGQSVTLRGIDLVDAFDEIPPGVTFLQLQDASLHEWRPSGQYDLITCVHGLHYVGDKLCVIEWAARALTDEGLFIANLDLSNLRLVNGHSLARRITRRFKDCGLTYDSRRHLLTCDGNESPSFGFHYVGADDSAGPNYSGQEAVDSYYEGG